MICHYPIYLPWNYVFVMVWRAGDSHGCYQSSSFQSAFNSTMVQRKAVWQASKGKIQSGCLHRSFAGKEKSEKKDQVVEMHPPHKQTCWNLLLLLSRQPMRGHRTAAMHLCGTTTALPMAGLDLESFELAASEGSQHKHDFSCVTSSDFLTGVNVHPLRYTPLTCPALRLPHSETCRVLKLWQTQLPLSICPSVKLSN